MANQPFATWPFYATGSSTTGFGGRTQPSRESDVINVKDWGAVGDHATDDTAAINAAIAYCVAQGGGTVFFPQGVYNSSTTIQVTAGSSSVGVALVGVGKQGTILSSTTGGGPNFSGNALERIEGIGQYISVTATRDGFSITDCHGGGGWNLTGAAGVFCGNCELNGTGLDANNANETNRGWSSGAYGISIGNGVVTGCRVLGGFEWAYCLSGDGSGFFANTTEVVGTAVIVGWDGTAEVQSRGAVIQGLNHERVNTGINLYNAKGCYVSGGNLFGVDGVATHAVISNITWSSATNIATVTTAVPHNLTSTTHLLLLDVHPTTYIPPMVTSTAQLVAVCTPSSSNPNVFTYPLTLSSAPAAFTDGGWNYPLQYTIRARQAAGCVIDGAFLQHAAMVVSVDLQYATASSSSVIHNNNTVYASNAQYGWAMPSSKNAAAWKFVQCNGTLDQAGIYSANPVSQLTFAYLPGSSVGSNQDGPFEGQEFDIIDGDSSNFDTAQTGGGTGLYRVRYQASSTTWRRVG